MAMKFWQLASITREERDLIIRIAESSFLWKKYENLYKKISDLIRTQNREILDSIIDDDFVVMVLEKFRRNLYLSPNNCLQSYKSDPSDKEFSILDSYKRYGGDVVEDVLEYGTVHVGCEKKSDVE